MTTALTLLISAMQLLTLVANTPNLSQEFKNNAIAIANQAVTVAQAELAKPSIQSVQQNTQITEPQVTPVTQVAPQLAPQPVFQNTQNNVIITGNTQTMEIIIKDEKGVTITDTVNVPLTNISYFMNVDVQLNGVSQKADITMTSSDNQTRTMLGSERGWSQRTMGGARDDGSANFLYRLNTTGEKTVTFTSGDTSKTITINVQ